MSAEVTRKDHALLIGDGWLLTAGWASVAMALLFGLSAIAGSAESQPVVAVLGNLLLLAGGIGGVVATWLLHGRRTTLPVVLGGLAGTALGGAFVPGFAALSFVAELILRPFTSWEFAGPVAMLVVVSVGLLVLTAWLLADAFRDLRNARAHARLDWARVAAAAAFAALAVVCAYLIFVQPGPEQGEAVIWAMAGGAIGAGVVAGADLAVWLVSRRPHGSSAVAAPQ